MKIYINERNLAYKEDGSNKTVPIMLTILIAVFVYFYFKPFSGSGAASQTTTKPVTLSYEQATMIPDDFKDPSCGEITYQTSSQYVNVSLNKKWVLKGKEFSDEEKAVILEATTSDIASGEDVKAYYTLTDNEHVFEMEKSDDNKFTATIRSDILEANRYNVKVIVTKKCTYLESKEVELNVSYPLYVAWTTDWEAQTPESQTALNEMDRISSVYGVPITHFFNPRIYINGSFASSKDRLTNWILKRQEKGDEIGIHLHMYFDMVQAAGVTPKKEPSWWDNRNDGYDVPSAAYMYDEYLKIITWGINTFKENGLPTPKSFRAGGWFADVNVLKAVNDAGIEIDSSGRTEYQLGNIYGYWHLETTVIPYHPSLIDQNTDKYSEKLDLLEIPNNDDYTWLATSSNMITQFEKIFKNHEPLDIMHTFVLLSHPVWYTQDFPRSEKTLAYISKYQYKDDNGPVIFATLSHIKEAYDLNHPKTTE